MNDIKLLIAITFTLISSSLVAQDNEVPTALERVLVYHNEAAMVAVLDEEGNVLKKIMDIPQYFEENYSELHYIKESYQVLSDKDLVILRDKDKELNKNHLATSESFEPENQ